MELGDYRLLAQIGAGHDGIAYRAEDCRSGQFVEVRVRSGARGDPERWAPLSRRLRTVALLDHPGAVRVRELSLESEPPFAVLEWLDSVPLTVALRGRVPLAATAAIQLGEELAAVLVAAHRLGLTHGRLTPGHIVGAVNQAVKLDFSGADVGTGPVAQAVDPADDVAALGMVLAWSLTGEHSTGVRVLATPGHFASPLVGLIQALTAPDPAERPSSRQAAEQLRRLTRALDVTGIHSAPPTAVGPDDLAAGLGETRLGSPDQPPVPVQRDELAGREPLGRYRLMRRLGQGGMGAV